MIEESTYGTTPTSPALKAVPFTSASDLGFTPETVVSEIIRDDRQISDLVLVGGTTSGGFDSELAAEAHDEVLEGVMFSAWGFPGGASLATAADADIAVIDDGITSTVLDLADGEDLGELNADDIVSLTGFTDGDYAVNKEYTVVSSTSAKITTASGNTTASAGAGAKTLTVVGKSGAITVASSAITTPAGWGDQLGLEAGDWVKVSGTGAGTYRVTGAVSSTSIPIANGGSGSGTGVVRTGAQLTNGTTAKSYTIERLYSDQDTPLYEYLRGMVPGTFSMTASSQSIVNSSFSFIGSDQEFTTSRVSGASDRTATASGVVSVYNSSSNVGSLAVGGAPVSGANFITEATVEIENNLRERYAVDNVGAVSIGSGEFNVTGTLNTYFDNKTLADAVVNNTATSFSISFDDANGKTLVFDLPNVKFSEGAPDVSGKNEDVMLNLSYQAILDADLGYTLKITRY
jgi:hypothetical protein